MAYINHICILVKIYCNKVYTILYIPVSFLTRIDRPLARTFSDLPDASQWRGNTVFQLLYDVLERQFLSIYDKFEMSNSSQSIQFCSIFVIDDVKQTYYPKDTRNWNAVRRSNWIESIELETCEMNKICDTNWANWGGGVSKALFKEKIYQN